MGSGAGAGVRRAAASGGLGIAEAGLRRAGTTGGAGMTTGFGGMGWPREGAGHLKNFSSTAATSPMVWGRVAGFLVSMRPMSLSMACGIAGSSEATDGGVSVACAMINSPLPSRTKGGRPHAISNRMHPRE